MQSDYYINLHFNQAVAQRTGYAFKIGDKGCTFHLHCEDLDPTGMLPHIVFNHPNNTCVEGIPTGSGRDYAYTIQGNEFAVIGKTVVDLKFYDALDATQRISTASFIIEILPDTYTPFEEASSSYADSLERAREELDDATSDLADMDALFAQTLQDYIDAFGNTAPINPRGAYDPNELYKPRDAVYFTSGGKTLTYLNNLECTGVDPTNTSNWQPIVDITGIPAIIDNCTSTSTTDALSANQGRVLEQQIEAGFNVLGAKNLNSYPYYETTKTENGVTFTDNGDGTITLNGTASANTRFIIHDNFDLYLKNGSYKMNGTPTGAGNSCYWYIYYKDANNNAIEVNDTGDEKEFIIQGSYGDASGAHVNVYLVALNGKSFSNVTIKPMIRIAEDTDPTFVPFAMTNRQLTKALDKAIIYKQYVFSVTGDDLYYKTIYENVAIQGYTLVGLTYTYNSLSYTGLLRAREGTMIYGDIVKVDGGIFTSNETVTIYSGLIFVKNSVLEIL